VAVACFKVDIYLTGVFLERLKKARNNLRRADTRPALRKQYRPLERKLGSVCHIDFD
jgi:hypothetical protein